MKNKITGDLEYVIDEPQFAVSEFHGFDTIYFGEKNKIEIESESSYNKILSIVKSDDLDRLRSSLFSLTCRKENLLE